MHTISEILHPDAIQQAIEENWLELINAVHDSHHPQRDHPTVQAALHNSHHLLWDLAS